MSTSIFENTMATMTWPEVDEAAKKGAIVMFPLAVIEAHGPHLPLGTDTFSSHTICCIVKEKLAYRGIPAVIAPPFYWGVNQATGAWPGSFSSRESTVRACLYDICENLKNFGFKKVYGVNIHGDPLQMRSMIQGCGEASKALGIDAKYVIDEWKLGYLNRQLPDIGLTGKESHLLLIEPEDKKSFSFGKNTQNELHASGGETACMLATRPETVRLDIAEKLPVVMPEMDDIMKWIAGDGSRELTPDCYIGAPAEYMYVDAMAKYTHLSELIVDGIVEDLK